MSDPQTALQQRTHSRNAIIDAKAAKLLAEIHLLHAERNSYSLAGSLPTGLLIRIFLELARDVFDNSLPRAHLLYPSYVCSHWRSIIIECTEFWSYTPISDSKTWPEEVVARSGDKPLRVWMKVHIDKLVWWSISLQMLPRRI